MSKYMNLPSAAPTDDGLHAIFNDIDYFYIPHVHLVI